MRIEGNVLIKVNNSDIKDGIFEFPKDIDTIGPLAFEWCSNLKTLVIPNTIKTIDKFAFNGCLDLTSIQLHDEITSIKDGAFYECGITEFTAPKGINELCLNVINNCPHLRLITLHTGISAINTDTFLLNKELKIIIDGKDEDDIAKVVNLLPIFIHPMIVKRSTKEKVSWMINAQEALNPRLTKEVANLVLEKSLIAELSFFKPEHQRLLETVEEKLQKDIHLKC